ncbi:MAG: Ig-like domain-containing protein [Acidobacteriota bacterium]
MLLGSPPGFSQEVLYNGIQLPAVWPPINPPSQLPSTPSYLLAPPSLIPIDVGRQLFVDNFLVEDTTLQRTAHRPVLYNRNPVLAPGQWPDPTFWAFPYSDGVWFDPADKLYKMWYLGGNAASLSYVYSTDGVNWIRPNLSLVPGTNRVLDLGGGRDSTTVWMDLEDPLPERKFKAFVYASGSMLDWYTSPNGINWTKQPNQILTLNDRTTFFWNPFRKRWINNIRGNVSIPSGLTRPGQSDTRARYYAESASLPSFLPYDPRTAFWMVADENDPPYYAGGQPPQMYALDAVAYESVMVGLFSLLHPGPEETAGFLPAPNLVEMGVGFSRDGFQWDRPTRGSGPTAFIPAANTPGAWDAYNSQSAGGVMLVVGDQLRFYFSGRSLQHYQPWTITPSATGLAILRRDGFYSMNAEAQEGVLTTRPVRFSGNRMFVNVKDPGGVLKAEVLDVNNQAIGPFTKGNSIAVSDDKTLVEMRWQGVTDLSSLAGRSVKIRFYLTNGELYSFWVTPSADGASNGYVGAGGPGFTGPTDTVGRLGASGGIDIVAPVPAITFPVANQTMTGAVTLSATATDNVGVTKVQFKIDGANFGPELSGPPFQVALDTSTLLPGTHEFSVTATDAELNSGTSSPVTATVTSGTPPVLSNGRPTGTLVAETTQAVVLLDTNGTATCKWASSPGITFPLMTNVFPVTGALAHALLVNGLTVGSSYKYYIRCMGADGSYNLNDYLVQFSVAADTTAPNLTMSAPANLQTVGGSLVIAASATDNIGVVGVAFLIDGNPLGAEDTTSPYSMSWNTADLLNGVHQVSAVARDAAGNSRTVSVLVTVLNVVLDTTPPKLSNGAPSGALPVGTSQTTLSVTTDEPAVCQYSATPGTAFSAMSAFQTTGNLIHTTQVTGLVNGQSYNYYLRCRDVSTNTNATDYAIAFSIAAPALPIFTQFIEAESGLPISPMKRVVDGGLQYIRTVEANGGTATYYVTLPFATTLRILGRALTPKAAYGSFYVSVDDASEQLWDIGSQISGGGIWSWLPVRGPGGVRQFDLGPGTHSFTFRGGAVNTYLDSLIFTSDPNLVSLLPPSPADTAPPILSNPLPVGALSTGTATTEFSVATNEFATCRYSTNQALSFSAMENSFPTTGGVVHSASLSGLVSGTTYEYMVKCQDAAGNANTQNFPVYFSVASAGQATGLYAQYFEAESGNLVAPMYLTLGDSQASGTKFIRSSTNGQGTAAYVLTVPASGAYVLWGRVQLPAGVPPRFYVSVDGAAEDVLTSNTVTAWSWRQVATQAGSPKFYDLAAGSHTIVVRSGTGNSYLDRLFLSNDPSFDPSGLAALTVGNGSPSGSLGSSTTQVPLTVTTNRPATCRYATTSGLSFASMPNLFATTGSTSHSSSLSGLSAGPYSYYVLCSDSATITSELSIQFSVADGVAPQISISAPSNGQTVGGTISISALATDNVAVAGVSFLVDGNPLGAEDTTAPYSVSWNTTTASNASHTLSAVARDASGNSRTAAITVSVSNVALDTLPPQLTGGAPSGTLLAGTTQAQLSLSTNESATCRYSTIAGIPFATMTSAFSTTGALTHSTPLSGLVSGNSYLVYVRCMDGSQNANTADYAITFSIANLVLDTLPPALSNGAPQGALPAGTTQVSLSLSTSEQSTCRYSATAGVAFDAMSLTFTTTGALLHTTPLSSLSSGTSYRYYVRCRDQAQNANTTDYQIAFSIDQAQTNTVFSQYQEAEAGVLVSPMTTLGWNTASGGFYIRSNTTNQGSTTLSFTVPASGNYILWGRVLSGNSNFDSLWVSVDGGPEDLWDTAQGTWSGNWQWTRVTGRNANGGVPSNGNPSPRVVPLSTGTHTFRFRGAETYTYLDRVFITNDPAAIPQ